MLIYWLVSQNLRRLRNSTKKLTVGINNRVKQKPSPVTNPGVLIGVPLPKGFFRLGVRIKRWHQRPASDTGSQHRHQRPPSETGFPAPTPYKLSVPLLNCPQIHNIYLNITESNKPIQNNKL